MIDEMRVDISDINNKVIDIDRRVTDIDNRVKTIESFERDMQRDISLEAPVLQQDSACLGDFHHRSNSALVNRGYKDETIGHLELQDIGDIGYKILVASAQRGIIATLSKIQYKGNTREVLTIKMVG